MPRVQSNIPKRNNVIVVTNNLFVSQEARLVWRGIPSRQLIYQQGGRVHSSDFSALGQPDHDETATAFAATDKLGGCPAAQLSPPALRTRTMDDECTPRQQTYFTSSNTAHIETMHGVDYIRHETWHDTASTSEPWVLEGLELFHLEVPELLDYNRSPSNDDNDSVISLQSFDSIKFTRRKYRKSTSQ